MKAQIKQPSKTPAAKSTVKPQDPTKAKGKKQDELSIDELAKVSGGVRRTRKFGRT